MKWEKYLTEIVIWINNPQLVITNNDDEYVKLFIIFTA